MKKKYLILSIVSLVLLVLLLLETINFMFRVSAYNTAFHNRNMVISMQILMVVSSAIGIVFLILALVTLFKKKPITHIFAIINSTQMFVLYGATNVVNHFNNLFIYETFELNDQMVLNNMYMRLIVRFIIISCLAAGCIVLSLLAYKLIKKLASSATD